MKPKEIPIFIVCLSLLAAACGRKPDAVFIVEADNITMIGEPAEAMTGEIRGGKINLIMPLAGNIVVFRENSTFHGLQGVKGRAYEISDGCTLDSARGLLGDSCRLDEVGTVTLDEESDEEIAQSFGVPKGSRVVRRSRGTNEKRTQPSTDRRPVPVLPV